MREGCVKEGCARGEGGEGGCEGRVREEGGGCEGGARKGRVTQLDMVQRLPLHSGSNTAPCK